VPTAPLVFSDSQSAVAAAVRGAGFVRVPALAVEAHIAAGLLRPLLMDWTPPNRAVWFKYASPMTPELEIFAEFVAGLLPSETATLLW
jgi:DNA-binding transcriptional LysR family regulator